MKRPASDDPVLSYMIELLRERLSAAELAQFQELAKSNLDALTTAINAELSSEALSGSPTAVVERVRRALGKLGVNA